jgi:hypothetical protein
MRIVVRHVRQNEISLNKKLPALPGLRVSLGNLEINTLQRTVRPS